MHSSDKCDPITFGSKLSPTSFHLGVKRACQMIRHLADIPENHQAVRLPPKILRTAFTGQASWFEFEGLIDNWSESCNIDRRMITAITEEFPGGGSRVSTRTCLTILFSGAQKKSQALSRRVAPSFVKRVIRPPVRTLQWPFRSIFQKTHDSLGGPSRAWCPSNHYTSAHQK